MKFPPELLDEIKARLPASQVIGSRVKLKRAGREWRGLSPFNAEKTPSFYVNDQKQFYHDFSSGKSGDIFKFLIETEGLSFPEAVERLANEAGVDLPRPDAQSLQREKVRASLHDALALAADWFERNLNEPIGARARGYLADRQIGAAAQRAFKLGYAPPERYALREALAAKGVAVEQMIEAGLLVHGEGVAVPYDRFQNRVMFPIHDRGGRVVAFGGRAMEPGAKAKYLNSPETELFHKGALLFNQHRARKAAHDKGELIAVEGYVDVIAMTQAGFPHTVAPLGTALTVEQCALLWTMCRDADALLRRRQGRTQGGLSRRRDGAAAHRGGKKPAIRAAARRAGPRRSRQIRRRRGDRGGAGAKRSRSPKCCSCARRRGKSSTPRSAARRWSGGCANSPASSPTRRCDGTMRRTWRSGSARCLRAQRQAQRAPIAARRALAAARFDVGSTPGRASAWRTFRCSRSGSANSPAIRRAKS